MSHAPPTQLFPALNLLLDGAHAPEENMARDLALLGQATGLLAKAQLRFYGWERECSSHGCLLPVAEAMARFPGLPTVQRPTGGGVLRHGFGRDFTYCLCVPYPAGYPKQGALPERHLLRLGVGESYCAIHKALAWALESLDTGLHVRLARGAECGLAPGQPPGPCFTAPTPGDILESETGEKVAGAAQKRTRRGLLQQGSIVLPEALASSIEGEALAKAFAHALSREVVIAGWPIS